MRLISKESKQYSILFNKCPKCHVGKFWASDNPFKNMFFSTENTCKSCENCSLTYELETGVMVLFWTLTNFFLSAD